MSDQRSSRAPAPPGSYFLFASLLTSVVAAAVRLRIHTGSALPSSTPFAWQTVGFAQDVLTLGALAMILMIVVPIGMSSAVARGTFSLCAGLLLVLYTMKSEAVVLFGATLHAKDFAAVPVATTVWRSLRGYSGFLLAASFVAAIGIAWVSSCAARRWPDVTLSIRGFGTAAAAGAIVLVLPLHVHRRETANSPVTNIAQMFREWRELDAGQAVSSALRTPAEMRIVREMAPTPRDFISDEYPLAYLARGRSAAITGTLKPNIVLIAVENLRELEVGAYGGSIPGLTPNIDRLAAEGIRFERTYSAGSNTPAGELALWYGLLPVPNKFVSVEVPSTPLTGLPEILRENGWRSMFWISSTDLTFYKRHRFYTPRGFQVFDGNSFPPEDPRVNWGVSDRALARRAVQAINRLPEPFAAMVLTVNNHHPFQLPSDAGPPVRNLPVPKQGFGTLTSGQVFGLHATQMIQTIHYSDQAVGDFFAHAGKQPWYRRTIFVITGDHGNAVAPLGEPLSTAHQLADLLHRVPLIIYSPLLARRGRLAGPASQIDVLPTVLSLLNIPVRTGLGVDLLDPAVDPNRPIFAWSERERMLTIIQGSLAYHCGPPPRQGQPPSDEILVDIDRDPDGRVNLADPRGGQLDRFRRLAAVYFEAYSPLVLSGRSGIPAGAGRVDARNGRCLRPDRLSAITRSSSAAAVEPHPKRSGTG